MSFFYVLNERNNIEYFKNNGIVDILKCINMNDFKNAVNKYIGDGLEINKRYNITDIHTKIMKNIELGLCDLYKEYNLDVELMSTWIRINTWYMTIFIDYKGINVWEEIGQYRFQYKARSNASVSNKNYTLLSTPMFEYKENEYVKNIEDLSMYDYIIRLLDYKRNALIGRYESEIASYKRSIRENRKMVKDLVNINLEEI